jgi:hypothetical protein
LKEPRGRLPEEGPALGETHLDVEEREEAGIPQHFPTAPTIEVGEGEQEIGGRGPFGEQ